MVEVEVEEHARTEKAVLVESVMTGVKNWLPLVWLDDESCTFDRHDRYIIVALSQERAEEKDLV